LGLERLWCPFAAGMRLCLPPQMRHLVRIAFPSLLGQGLDKLLECLAVQLDVGSRLLRPLLCLALDLRSRPARGDVGTVVENVDELERVELIHLWPVAKREPHDTHDKDATPLPRAVQADWAPPNCRESGDATRGCWDDHSGCASAAAGSDRTRRWRGAECHLGEGRT